jgi:hypothetical protein
MSAERNAYHKSWREKKALEDPLYSHKKALRELYKVTAEWYEAKLKEQNGTCALCDSKQQAGNSKKRLSVDHDHNCCPNKRACGKCNRGLLCFNCNKRLAHLESFLKDTLVLPFLAASQSWTAKALRYLTQYSDQEKTQCLDS